MTTLLHRIAVCIIWMMSGACANAQTDPLPSWNEGASKSAIIDFISRTTAQGQATFVPRSERIAVFDNDGTLWCEKPLPVQAVFAVDSVRQLASRKPEWKSRQPFKGILENDHKAVAAAGMKGVESVISATHSGMTTDDFRSRVLDWLKGAQHAQFKRPYTELVYQPMLELLAHLRANGFTTYVVSGGGVEFMRPWMQNIYGIPPEQVVGSSGVVRYQKGSDGKYVLIKEPKIEFIDDGPGKPVGINRFIGRRPIFAAGNSDGDLQMLQYTADGPGLRLALYVHHDDAEREFAYDRKDRLAKLDKGLDEATARKWPVVSMKRDWQVIFPPVR